MMPPIAQLFETTSMCSAGAYRICAAASIFLYDLDDGNVW